MKNKSITKKALLALAATVMSSLALAAEPTAKQSSSVASAPGAAPTAVALELTKEQVRYLSSAGTTPEQRAAIRRQISDAELLRQKYVAQMSAKKAAADANTIDFASDNVIPYANLKAKAEAVGAAAEAVGKARNANAKLSGDLLGLEAPKPTPAPAFSSGAKTRSKAPKVAKAAPTPRPRAILPPQPTAAPFVAPRPEPVNVTAQGVASMKGKMIAYVSVNNGTAFPVYIGDSIAGVGNVSSITKTSIQIGAQTIPVFEPNVVYENTPKVQKADASQQGAPVPPPSTTPTFSQQTPVQTNETGLNATAPVPNQGTIQIRNGLTGEPIKLIR